MKQRARVAFMSQRRGELDAIATREALVRSCGRARRVCPSSATAAFARRAAV